MTNLLPFFQYGGTRNIGSKPIPVDAEHFGELRRSDDCLGDGDALRERLEADGYLYLPGALPREPVLAARRECVTRLAKEGALAPDTDPMEARAAIGKNRYFSESIAEDNEPLFEVVYGKAMLDIFRQLFDTKVRHFDYTWLRAVSPGNGTTPHCDSVYMNRGTDALVTAWTPLGDIPVSEGGLVMLEGSHRERERKLAEYLRQDVDTFCENGPNADKIRGGKMGWEHYDGSFAEWNGTFCNDAAKAQQLLGGRWLTSPEFRMGDVLLFGMATLHGSLDNTGDRIRLSSDTRYQPANVPVDERWVRGANGERPVGHGLAGKRGKIC
ncbi:MAG: phytanoyl-CoA dioxygenase family protein [Armatimonadetes bacterium]|nr:phytanoyl-CoA dioxygenase family protein [Armatimonadota bacterium]